MPKVTLTAAQRQDRAFLAALRGGQAMRGERDCDTVHHVNCCRSTYYKNVHKPGEFSMDDVRRLVQRYYFNDRQLCEAFGIEYNGATPR